MTRKVFCVKANKEVEGLEKPPYPGEFGQKIYENVGKEAWQEWLEHQKMLVNEYRLNLMDQRARKMLLEQTQKHFFEEGEAQMASGYVPPADKQ